MAKIEQSTGLAKSAVTGIIKNLIGLDETPGHLYFMKGLIPGSLNNVTNPRRYRKDDRLIHWNINQIKLNQNNIIYTTASLAMATGHATWFHWYRINGSFIYQIIGSVTKEGMGGDIIIHDTTFAKGASYAIANLKISIPEEFTNIKIDTTPKFPMISVSPTTGTWTVYSSN
jgi:hypothetical protein